MRIAPVYRYIEEAGVLIRPARESDVPAIREITVASYPSVSGHRMREEYFGVQLGGRPWQEHKAGSVEALCRAHPLQVIVAEADGKLVGFATYSLDEKDGIGEIGDNAVAPGNQGKGIGTRLQREVDRRMREEGYQRFTVTTLSVDHAARRVYEKLGYELYSDSLHFLRKA